MDEREYGTFLSEVEEVDAVAEWSAVAASDDEGYDETAGDEALNAFCGWGWGGFASDELGLSL